MLQLQRAVGIPGSAHQPMLLRGTLGGENMVAVVGVAASTRKGPQLCRGPICSRLRSGACSVTSAVSSEIGKPELTASGSGSPRSSVRTTSARIDHDVIFAVGAFLLLPFVFSYIELIRLPSIRMCAAFLIVCETYFRATWPKDADPVPFRLRGPLVLCVLPRPLRCDGKNGELGPKSRHARSRGDTNRSRPPHCDPVDNPACLSRPRSPAGHPHW